MRKFNIVSAVDSVTFRPMKSVQWQNSDGKWEELSRTPIYTLMGLELEYKDGQTPLSEEAQDGLLIDSITTHGELDEFEQMNIQKAMEWSLTRKFKKEYILSERFVKELHKRMLKDVWKWAGEFRLTEKNIGIKFYQAIKLCNSLR